MSKPQSGRRTDSATRVIAASPEAIYRVFVDGNAWPRWLPPEGMTGRIELFEPYPGGRYRMVLTYRGDHANRGKATDDTDVAEGRFAELVQNERVVHVVSFKSEDISFAGEMIMAWMLSPAPGGTSVSIVCENVPEGISAEDHTIGLNSTLSNLARYLGASRLLGNATTGTDV